MSLILRSPNDIVATLPYLAGEPPKPGLAVITLDGGRVGSVAYCDLGRPKAPDPVFAAQTVTTQAMEEGCGSLLVVGYGTGEQITAYVHNIIAEAKGRGLTVMDALGVHDGRYWSYTCERPECCPPEGTRIDPDRSVGPAEAVFRGISPRSVADQVAEGRRSLVPSGVVQPETVEAATAVAEAETENLRSFGEQALRDHAARVMREVIETERTGAGPQDVETLVRLAVYLRDIKVRDIVWKKIIPETAGTHLDLWSRVTRTAAFGDRAAPASLVAVAAWLRDDTALAQGAFDTALSANPNYSMAKLMQHALKLGLPVDRWTEFLKSLD